MTTVHVKRLWQCCTTVWRALEALGVMKVVGT